MWALMDHNVQLLEDFKHANVDAPGVPSLPGAVAQPAVMVRPSLQGPPDCIFPCHAKLGRQNSAALKADRHAHHTSHITRGCLTC